MVDKIRHHIQEANPYIYTVWVFCICKMLEGNLLQEEKEDDLYSKKIYSSSLQRPLSQNLEKVFFL